MVNRIGSFTPDYAVAPGETLKEWRQSIGDPGATTSTGTAAMRCNGMPVEVYERIESGEQAIDEEIAANLARGTDIPEQVWLNLQRHYDADMARIADQPVVGGMGSVDAATVIATRLGRTLAEVTKRRYVRRYEGPVVIAFSNTNPHDFGEPLEFVQNGVTYLTLPSIALWTGTNPRTAADETASATRAHRPIFRDGPTRTEIACSCGDPASAGDDEFVAHIFALADGRELGRCPTCDCGPEYQLGGDGVTICDDPYHRGTATEGVIRAVRIEGK